MGMKDIAFFRGLNKTAAFARLSEFLVKDAVLACISENLDAETFIIENHQNRCVTYYNHKTLVFVLVENDLAVIKEIRKAKKKITHLETFVLTIELEGVFINEDQINLNVYNIINAAVKIGIPRNNLFLLFLKELFDLAES
jgi:hypothetical protein